MRMDVSATHIEVGPAGRAAFVLLLAAGGLLAAATGARAEERVLHTFTGAPDGNYVQAGMTSDASGNLFGATAEGGVNNQGAVYELKRNGGGTFSYSVIYSLGGADIDGMSFPQGRVGVGPDGHLYISTVIDAVHGNGGIFELVPDTRGGWKLGRHILFDGSNGAKPQSGVVVDTQGHIYGNARVGGVGNVGEGYGTVFEVVSEGGRWKIEVLHKFSGSAPEGAFPKTELLVDKHGDLYGTSDLCVYKLHNSGGTWQFSTIYEFTSRQGDTNSAGALHEDSAGNLYGTADVYPSLHGTPAQVVYKLSQPTYRDRWTWSELFRRIDTTGGFSSVSFDESGNAYLGLSMALTVGAYGQVLKLTPSSSGPWIPTVLHRLNGSSDGAYPGQLLVGPAGILYGVTGGGGSAQGFAGDGVLFSLPR